MKDDYRWYNSALFAQREAILAQSPELAPQIHNNKSLKPFLERPAHLVNRDALVEQAAFVDKQQAALGSSSQAQPNPRQAASLYVCCPQGKSHLIKRIILQDMVNKETTVVKIMRRLRKTMLHITKETTSPSMEDGYSVATREEQQCTPEIEKESLIFHFLME